MRIDEYKKRHAKQVTTAENTLWNLRINIEKAKVELREKEDRREERERKLRGDFRPYLQGVEDSYQHTMQIEKIAIPITYQSRYDHTFLSSTPSEFIKARHKGILTSVILIIITLIQLYIVWENPVVGTRDVLYKIAFGCGMVLLVKLLYWIITGGLREFLNT